MPNWKKVITSGSNASLSSLYVANSITASAIYSSGSNQLGDATNDTQTLIGTVIVSGSQKITGSISIQGSISTQGNVGINTTASSAWNLDVTGSTGTLRVANSSFGDIFTVGVGSGNQGYSDVFLNGQSYGLALYANPAVLSSYTVTTNPSVGSITYSTASVGLIAGGSSGALVFGTQGTEKMRVHLTGDVSIGLQADNKTPSGYKLNVTGSGVSGSLNINNVLKISDSNVTITGSLSVSQGITGSLLGTASYAATASRISGGTDRYVPLWDGNNSLTSSYIQQNTSGVIQTISGSYPGGIYIDINNSSYRFGGQYVSSSYIDIALNTILTHDVSTNTNKGFSLELLSNLYQFGDYSNTFHGNTIRIDDNANEIKTYYNGNPTGLFLDTGHDTYVLGDYGATPVNIGGWIKVDNTNEIIGTSNTKRACLWLDIKNHFSYLGDYHAQGNTTYLTVDDGSQIIKTSNSAGDKGLYLNLAGNYYYLGNESAMGYGVGMAVDDNNRFIGTKYGGAAEGFYFDFANRLYTFGNIYTSGNSTNLIIDDVLNRITTSGSFAITGSLNVSKGISTRSSGSLLGSNINTATASILVQGPSTGGPYAAMAINPYGNTGVDIQSATNGGGTIGGLILLNRQGGNVAINKATANAQLDVNGNTIITGSLTVTGGIVGGSSGYTVVAVSSTPYNAAQTSGDIILLVDAATAGGNTTINLPTAVGNTAKFTIKKIDGGTNSVIVDGNGTETIDGGLTATMLIPSASITIISNNANWFII